jgi:uncharacterized protein with PIN domain
MKFLCDIMLGRLARYLRMLGFDAVHTKSTAALGPYKEREDVLFLTKRKKVMGFKNMVYIKADKAKEQLREIKDIIGPYIDRERFMTRCIICNVGLEDIGKEEVEGLVPEFVFHTYKEFKRCPSCKRIYWEGTHTDYMERFIEEVLGT